MRNIRRSDRTGNTVKRPLYPNKHRKNRMGLRFVQHSPLQEILLTLALFMGYVWIVQKERQKLSRRTTIDR